MLDTSSFGNVGHQLSLLLFFDVLELSQFMSKVVGDREEAVSAFQSFLESRLVGDVTLLERNVGAQLEEVLRGGLVGIAGQCTDLSG